MNYNQMPLLNKIATLTLSTLIVTGPARFLACKPLESPPITKESASPNLLLSAITTCRTHSDLAEKLPEISFYLKRMAKEKDIGGLMTAYENIRIPILMIFKADRQDLNHLYELFTNARSKEEKMAAVFLSLPRLFEREMTISNSDGVTIETIRRANEEGFIRGLEASGYKELAQALGTYWYKKDGLPPTKNEQARFMAAFAELY